MVEAQQSAEALAADDTAVAMADRIDRCDEDVAYCLMIPLAGIEAPDRVPSKTKS